MNDTMSGSNEVIDIARIHQAIFGNGKGYGFEKLTDNAASLGSIVQQYPQGHIPFDYQSTINLPVGTTQTAIIEFKVPDGYTGLINSMTNMFLGGSFDPTAQDIVWRLLADNRPIRNFEAMYAQKGSLETPRPVDGIKVYGGQTIQLVVEHLSNAALNGPTLASLGGFFYPAT